jgi:hypothetical protein
MCGTPQSHRHGAAALARPSHFVALSALGVARVLDAASVDNP